MTKRTVQDLIVDRLDRIEAKMDGIIPVLEGLKVKAAIAGGLAGLVGTGIVTMLLSAFKFK